MPARLRARLTYANVMATVAVFLALGGGAYAAATIGSRDIKANAVRSKHIKQGQVRTGDLGGGAVSTGKLRAGAVRSDRLADGAVTNSKIADLNVTGTKLGLDAVTSSRVSDNSLTGADVSDNSLTGADVSEPSLGVVPSAATADNVDGSRVVQFQQKTVAETGLTTVVSNLGGLTLKLGCPGSAPRLQATTAQDDAYLQALPGADTDLSFDRGETHDVINWGDNDGFGTAVYRSNSGDVVTITLAYHDATEAGAGCMVGGTAVGG